MFSHDNNVICNLRSRCNPDTSSRWIQSLCSNQVFTRFSFFLLFAWEIVLCISWLRLPRTFWGSATLSRPRLSCSAACKWMMRWRTVKLGGWRVGLPTPVSIVYHSSCKRSDAAESSFPGSFGVVWETDCVPLRFWLITLCLQGWFAASAQVIWMNLQRLISGDGMPLFVSLLWVLSCKKEKKKSILVQL